MKQVEVFVSGQCSDEVFQQVCGCIDHIMKRKEEIAIRASSRRAGEQPETRVLEFTIIDKGAEK